jgi:hypothetical protein
VIVPLKASTVFKLIDMLLPIQSMIEHLFLSRRRRRRHGVVIDIDIE